MKPIHSKPSSETMTAVVMRKTGGTEVLQLEDVPLPIVEPEDVLIKVAACGVCFHDIVARRGVLKHGVQLPIIPGHEVSGEVVAVGRRVKGLNLGQRVACVSQRFTCGQCKACRSGRENLCREKVVLGDWGLNGGYAEYVAVNQRGVSAIPDEVSYEEASIAGCPICCQLNAIHDVGQVRPGETVLVTGAGGGVGIHGVELAKNTGAHVIAVTSNPEKLQQIRNAGANEVILVAKGEDFSAKVLELTNSEGVDVAIDNVGTPTWRATRRSIGRGGRWVCVGQVNGDFVPFNPAQLFLRGIDLLSATGSRKSQLDAALRMMALGQVHARVDRTMPLSSVREAHEIMEKGALMGRIVLTP